MSTQDEDRNLRHLPRNIWVVTAASFLTDISSEMIVHLIPFFLVNVLGVRLVTIGLIEGLAETTASLAKLYFGRLSDRLGRRKWLTVAGYGLSAVAKPFLALANSWQAVLAVRFTERMGKGIRTSPRDALIADSINERQRGLAFGLHRAGDTAGAALGLLATLVVIWLMQGGELNLARSTFQTLVWLSIIPAMLAVILLAIGIREGSAKREDAKKAASWRELPRPFKRFLLVIILFTLGNSADAFLMLRAQAAGLSLALVIVMLVLFNLVYAIVATPAGSLSDKIGRRQLLLAGWLLYGLVYVGFALAGTGWQIGLLFAFYGVYYGLTAGVAKAFVADLVGQEQRGTAFGWFNASIGLAALPASLIAGLLWQGIGDWTGLGMPAPFLFGALLAISAVFLLLAWFPNTTRNSTAV